ncbi:hypothetical protein VTN00DRAFT_3081 [Thermoascus crustaceus]|uniref:uncharacterized protein n=1 Tax=Thermoascus crustaceus TaxID=5088 RepID=UPI0037420B8C
MSSASSPSPLVDGNSQTVEEKHEKKEEEEEETKLSPMEFRAYNRLADHMEMFHNHFRLTWNELYSTCTSKTNQDMDFLSTRRLIQLGLQFCSQLGVHHSIEEEYIFPELATKMPEFRPGNSSLLAQHEQIHEGMDRMEAYLRRCLRGKIGEEDQELRLEEVKRLMDGFGEVLWRHLDEEVRTLGAENMRRYWTLEEMRRLPI